MNTRVLELIKNPQTIQVEDLKTLETEIHQFPYIQNIRALYLYGVHLFDVDNYQKELSKTAAYTTDKKILYQLINQSNKAETSTIEIEAIPPQGEKETPMEVQEPQEECSINPSTETLRAEVIDAVYGVRNRILFEGEENFWKEITASKESIEEVETSENANHKLSSESEIVQNNSETSEIKEEPSPIKATPESTEDHASELSFHGVDTFLPDVHIPVERKVETYQPKPTLNKHEEEMKRLVAEVEAKIKAKKEAQKQQQKEETHEGEDAHNREINFAETQSFEVMPKSEASEPEAIEDAQQSISKFPKEKKAEETVATAKDSWKPMALEPNQPDALLGKVQTIEKTTPQQPTTSEPEEQSETLQEERPVFNVSFFSSDTVTKIEEEVLEESEDSNVPMFINTWQKWLKIDRNEPKETESSEDLQPEIINEPAEKETETLTSTIEDIKEKAIENFIENEPKISKLKKEETQLIIKEKTDDISHLMTETLANLYVEQRLYTKAIEAYQVLQEKYPEKTESYAAIIEDINQQKNSHRF